MSDKLFTDEIYKEGLQVYNENKVGRIKTFANQYHCLISDGIYYKTVIAIDKNKDIIGMNCSCHDAKDGKKCKHEAAVYIHMVNQKLVNAFINTNDFSLKVIYNQYVPYFNGCPCETDIDDFLIKVNNELKRILKITAAHKPMQIFEYMKAILIDYSAIDLPKKSELIIETYFIEQLNCLFIFNKEYICLYIEWFKKVMMESKYLTIIDLLFKINGMIDEVKVLEMYVQLLKIQSVISNDYIVEYMQNSIADIVVKTPQYFRLFSHFFENDIFSDFLMIFRFIELKEYRDAYQLLKNFYKQYPNHSLTQKLDKLKENLNEYSQNSDDYIEEVIKLYSYKHNHSKMKYIEKLKTFLGDGWNTRKYEFYDAIKLNMTDKQIVHFLEKNEEADWPSYYLLGNPSIHNFITYHNLVRVYDLKNYAFIVMECFIGELSHFNTLVDLEKIIFQLYDICYIDVEEDLIIEILKEIKYVYNENIELKKVIDNIMKEVLVNENSITY